MGKGSYNGGSLIIRAVGWCATNSGFGKNRPLVRLGQHSKKRSAALAAKKGKAKESEKGRGRAVDNAEMDKKELALKGYPSFNAYESALLIDPELARSQGIAPIGNPTASSKTTKR